MPHPARIATLLLLAAALAAAPHLPAATISCTGILTRIDANTLTLQATPSPRTILLTSQTSIWKGEDNQPPSVLQPGDELSVRGIESTSGAIIAQEIWANITSLAGRITRLGPGLEPRLLWLKPASPTGPQDPVKVAFTNATLGDRYNLLDHSLLKPGLPAHIIALRLPDGSLRATRILLNPDRRSHPQPKP